MNIIESLREDILYCAHYDSDILDASVGDLVYAIIVKVAVMLAKLIGVGRRKSPKPGLQSEFDKINKEELGRAREKDLKIVLDTMARSQSYDEVYALHAQFKHLDTYKVHRAMVDAEARLHNEWRKREDSRLSVQEKAPYQCVYYQVYYNVPDDDLRNVDDLDNPADILNGFPSLSPAPDDYGWWRREDTGRRVMVTSIIRIERVTVDSVKDIPKWFPHREIDGQEVRVAPKRAEALKDGE